MNEIKDKIQRDDIVNKIDRSIFVEAGAGSGKTQCLADRMVNIVRIGKITIDQIYAITFTKKAASELRERFQVRLEKKYKELTDAKDKEYILKALISFERVHISTIHSFCAGMLRERPLEAHIVPDFVEMEDEDDSHFADESWMEYINHLGKDEPEKITNIDGLGVKIEDLQRSYHVIRNFQDINDKQIEDVPKPDFSTRKTELSNLIFELAKKVPVDPPKSGWDDMMKQIRKGYWVVKNHEKTGFTDAEFAKLLEIFRKPQGATYNRWEIPTADVKKIEAKIIVLCEQIANPLIREWQEYLHKIVLEFILNGIEYYQKRKAKYGCVNFQDLLIKTRDMLKNSEPARIYFKNRIKCLLMDEFQDTDPIQAEIALLLTSDEAENIEWQDRHPSPGALFIVGDPKQSIYRFRRADIDTYEQVKATFNPADILELTTNFRSFKPIEDITNTVFKPLLTGDKQAKYAPLETIKDPTGKGLSGVFKLLVSSEKFHYPEPASKRNAKTVAAWIKSIIDGKKTIDVYNSKLDIYEEKTIEPADFMILTKRKATLRLYARELESIGIPSEVAGDEGFGRSVEIFEIYKILNAINDSKNEAAVVAALKGLFFGFSDNDLFRHRVELEGSFSIPVGSKNRKDERSDKPTDEKKGLDNINQALEKLADLRSMIYREIPYVAFRKILQEFNIMPYSASKDLGASRAGNIVKLTELIRGFELSSSGSFNDIVERIGEYIDCKKEEIGIFNSESKAVRIMNLHKAKGLEAPIVILVDPIYKKGNYESEYYVPRGKGSSKGYFAVYRPDGDNSTKPVALPRNWIDYQLKQSEYEDAEKIRLDYVAVTRAINVLVISYYDDKKCNRPKTWENINSYVHGLENIIGSMASPAIKKEKVQVTGKELEIAKENIVIAGKAAEVASYALTSVTKDLDDEFGGEGVGDSNADYGNAAHEIMEYCVKNNKDAATEEIIKYFSVKNDVDAAERLRLKAAIARSLANPHVKSAITMEEKITEVPFSLKKKDGTIISGKIDLVYKINGEWIILDYKTMDFDCNLNVKKKCLKQLKYYREYWKQLTNEEVKEGNTHLIKVI